MNVESPVASPIELGPRAPGFWIRRYLPEKDAFVLVSVEGHSPEFLAALDPQSPTRGRARETIMAALFGQPRSLAPVRLLVFDRSRQREKDGAASTNKILTITDAFQTRLMPDNDSRKILDSEGRVISRWSDGLEEAVDHYGRIWLAQRALDFFAETNTAGSERGNATSPNSFFAMLEGRESVRKCRYNPNLPLRLQLGREPTTDESVNYSAQRAIIDLFAQHVGSDDSELAKAQGTLLESGSLLAAPPVRSAALLRMQTSEAARGIAAQLLAGLMELNGTEPATEDFDELWAPKPDGSFGRRPTLHDEILREMAPHPIAESINLAEKTEAYLALGRARLARYESEARQIVAMEQAKTAMPAKTLPSALPLEPFERDQVPGQTPRSAKRFKKVARPAAGALDLAQKLTAETETVPWF